MTIDVSYLKEAERLCSMFERDNVNLAVQLERNDLLRRIAKTLEKPINAATLVEVTPEQPDRHYYVFDFKAEGLLIFSNNPHAFCGWCAFFEGRRRKDHRLEPNEFFARSSFKEGWDKAFERWLGSQ